MCDYRRLMPKLTWWLLLFVASPLPAEETPTVAKCMVDLKHSDIVVRRQAARELRRMGPAAAPAVEALLLGVDPQDKPLYEAVTAALIEIGEPALPTLLQRYAALSPEQQMTALVVFARYPDKLPESAAELMLPTLNAPHERIVEQAGKTLRRLGPRLAPIVPQLFAAAFDEEQPQSAKAVAARDAISGLGPEIYRIVPLLAARLETVNSGEMLLNAGEILSWHRPDPPRDAEKKIVPDLVKLAWVSSDAIVNYSMSCLARLGGDAQAAIPGLEAIIGDVAAEKRTRYLAVRCLTAIVDRPGVGKVIAWAKSESPDVRVGVVVSLTELGIETPGVRATLERLRDDEVQWVRSRAYEVLEAEERRRTGKLQ